MKYILSLLAAGFILPFTGQAEPTTTTLSLDFTQAPRYVLWGQNFYRTVGSWDFANVGIGIRSTGPGRYIYHPDGSTASAPFSQENTQFLNETINITFRNNASGNNTLGLYTRVNPTSGLGIYGGIAFTSGSEVKLSLRYDFNVKAAQGATTPGNLFYEETFTLSQPIDFTPYYRLSLLQGGGENPVFTLQLSTLSGEVLATSGEIVLGAFVSADIVARYTTPGAIGVDYTTGTYQGSTLGSFEVIPEGSSAGYTLLGGVLALGAWYRWRGNATTATVSRIG